MMDLWTQVGSSEATRVCCENTFGYWQSIWLQIIQSLQLKLMGFHSSGVVLYLHLLFLLPYIFPALPSALLTSQERMLQADQPKINADTFLSNQFTGFDLANSASSVSFGTVSDEVLTEQIQNNQVVDSNSLPSQPLNQNSSSSAAAESPKPVPQLEIAQLNKPILGKGFKENLGISFQLIHLAALEKKYLFLDLKLAEKDRWQKVSYTVTIQGTEKILLNCSSTQYDSCFIPRSSLKENVNIFVLITCEDDCTYNLRGRWSDLEHLKPGDDFSFTFGEEKSQLFHIELEGVPFEEFRIHLSPRTTRVPFENAKLFGKYGFQLDPTAANYDFTSVNLWEDGQGVFLKRSLMKSMSVAVLLVGQGETTYRLTCQAITDTIHEVELNEHLYEYMPSSSEKSYHASIPNLNEFDEFSFKISVFSGELSFEFFSDKEMKTKVSDHIIRSYQLEYMKDSELFITRRDIDQFSNSSLAGFYIQAKTSGKSASFTFKYSARKYNSPVEMNEHVYSFIPVEGRSRFAWFNFRHWASETDQSANLRFTTSVIEVAGIITPTFYICKSTLELCSSSLWANYTTPLKIMKKQSLSEKTLFEFEIPHALSTNINSFEKEAIVMVYLDCVESKDSSISIIAMEFINNNKVLYLRENRPLEEKLFAGELKLYKYINSDPNVREVRVHVNHVEGDFTYSGLIKNEDSSRTETVFASGSSLIFNKDLNLPLIITVSAVTRSIYSISMQVIHKGEEETEVVNAITIGEDLSYSVKIMPMQSTVFEVVPIFYEFNFAYEASQTVLACLADVKTNMCIGINDTDISPIVAKKQAITKAKLTNRRAHVKISNPSSLSIAEVRVMFHSRALSRCLRKKMGLTYHETVEDKSCFQFLLDERKNESLEIYASKRELSSYEFTVFLCGNSIKGAEFMKIVRIDAPTIKSHCSSSIEGWKVGVYWNQKTADQKQDRVKVDMIVQYESNSILLAEGVAYHSKVEPKGGVLKKYAFELINKVDTRVIISSIAGIFSAYAKIMHIGDRDREEVSNTNFNFESRYDVDYKQEPIILIPASAMLSAACSQCVIVVAVYAVEGQWKLLEYDIQIVQTVQELTDNSAINGYLQANSSAYYTYEAHEKNQTHYLFVLSDHNRGCANLYLGLFQYPGPGNNIAAAEQDSILLYKHPGGSKTYFLTVEATKVCEYSLAVVTSDSSIFKIERGKHYLIRLLKGSVQYFFFESGNEPFKIFAMNKFGDVKFYLKRSDTQMNRRSFTSEELSLQNFEFTGEHPNVLSIDKTNSLFCESCHYILAVEALKSSFSTLVLAYPMSLVTLPENKFLSDELHLKNDILYLAYKRVEKTKLKLSVHKGGIEVSAFYKTSQATQVFDAKSEHQTMTLDLEREVGKERQAKTSNHTERLPINIMVKATQPDTSYTIHASPYEDGTIGSADIYQDVATGQPNHIMISSEKVLCLRGYFRDENEALVISVNHDNQHKLAGITLKAKINRVEANISKEIVRNLLNINLKYPQKVYQGAAYELCLKYEEVQEDGGNNADNMLVVEEQDDQEADNHTLFNAIVTQDNTVNLLPSDTEAVVKGSSTFTIHHFGEFLLDVFECKEIGKTRLSYAKDLNDLQDSKSKSISVMSLEEQSHALRLPESDSSTIYVSIKSAFSTVRWLPIDLESDEGTGYMKFAKGDLKYTSKFKYVTVEFQGLQNVKPTKSVIREIDYSILIANDSSQLESLSNCDVSDRMNLIVIPLGKRSNPSKSSEKTYYKHEVQKSYLQKHFSADSNIYISVVAKLTLEVANRTEETLKLRNPSSDEHEHYRFIYNRQQMPLESYKQSQIESIPYHLIIVIVLSAIVLLLLATYLFTSKIIPLLARLKNSNLVEDQDLQAGDKDAMQVPPSSDRNQRQPQVAVETEEKMAK